MLRNRAGVGVGLEVGVDQVRDLARMAVQLDQVGAFDLAEVRPVAALVDAEQRVERFQGAAVEIQGVGQQLADVRASAGVIDGLGVAGLEQPVVGQKLFGAGLPTPSRAGPRVSREGTPGCPAGARSAVRTSSAGARTGRGPGTRESPRCCAGRSRPTRSR